MWLPTLYTYDADNRLIGEIKDQGGTTTTSVYTYDDNGNLLTERDAANTAVATHSYDALNRLISSAVGAATTTYTYNPQGIRTSRTVGTTTTDYLLDGGNVVGEITGEAVTTYLRGANLISDGTNYYLHNAHGDVTMLANAGGAVVKNYAYDAFGNQLNTVADDTNPFRYCGEYYDTETGNYYLRARYYDPTVGRFTQQDTHWNTANMIYGDTMQKLNVTVDAEGGEYFTAIPQLLAIRQAGNLYAYAANDPISFADYSGEQAITVYFDQNRDFTLSAGSFLFGAAISIMLIDELADDDPPILYAKKGTKGTSHPNSAVSMGGASPASPDPDDDPDRNWEKVSERHLEKKLKEQGMNPHSVKKEYLGQKAEIKKFDIYIDKNSGQLGIFEKSTGKLVDITHYFIK